MRTLLACSHVRSTTEGTEIRRDADDRFSLRNCFGVLTRAVFGRIDTFQQCYNWPICFDRASVMPTDKRMQFACSVDYLVDHNGGWPDDFAVTGTFFPRRPNSPLGIL